MAKPQINLPKGQVEFFRRVLGQNGALMILSALISALILGAVHQQVLTLRHERTFPVPVSVKSPDDEIAVAAFDPATVQITLRGSQDEIAVLDPSRLEVELFPKRKDVSASKPLSIQSQNIIGSGKLKIVSVEPSRIDVRYDYMVSWNEAGRRIATPKLVGVPVQGSASVEMPTNLVVVVHGSESKINAFREKKILLPTSSINVEGKTESFDAPVAIIVPPDSGITKVEPATVTVHVEVKTVAAAGLEEDTAPLVRVAQEVSLAAALLGPEASLASTNSVVATNANWTGAACDPVETEPENASDSGEVIDAPIEPRPVPQPDDILQGQD